MKPEQMWEEFSKREKIISEYDVWAFGVDADKLALLVLEGTKTATASAYALYQLEGEQLPRPGQYSVILNSQDEAVCIIRNVKVQNVPYDAISEEHAWKEGEGDRSLSYWRKNHEDFFRKCMAEAGQEFTENMLVVCEEFVRVFP